MDKGLRPEHLGIARLDTLVGALWQTVTAASVVAAAATLGRHGGGPPLDNVPQIATALSSVLGDGVGRVVFGRGLSGAALVAAAIVACLSAAWAAGEVAGSFATGQRSPFEAPWLYGALGISLALAAVAVASGVNLVRLSIAAGVANAMLLPIVLGFLFWMARATLPEAYRLQGLYAALVAAILAATAGLGLYAGVAGALG